MDIKRVIRILSDPKGILVKLNYNYPLLFSWMPDEMNLKFWYRYNFGKKLNLDNPETFNEKLQWLKLNNRKDEYTRMVDKYEVKEYVASIVGDQFIIPTLGVWDSFDEIDFDALPKQFVLKCTHDSGGLVICKDKSKLDLKAAKKKIQKSLKRSYYWVGREWPYKNVKPRIIAEAYMQDSKTNDLKDYKFFCFGGVAKCFKVDFDRYIEHHANYYDMQRNLLDFGEAAYPPNDKKKLDINPETLEEMQRLAEKLSEDIPFLRADFYDVNGRIYFGELTFYPASGFGKFTSEQSDQLMGKWISIRGGVVLLCGDTVAVLKEYKNDLTDYKFFCFNGDPKYCQVIGDRSVSETMDFFDMNWKIQPFTKRTLAGAEFPHSMNLEKPKHFDEMVCIARKLAGTMPFSRIDLYEINDKVYFGEITFFPNSGLFNRFSPDEWDLKLGKMIAL